MKTPYGAWRASYVHGRWTVLSGPTSMVILEPAPDNASDFIEELWTQLIDCASATELVRTLADHGLEKMPNLAVFFWDDEQLRCLLRGSLRILDADDDTELASGAGAITWREMTLSSRSVYLPLDETASLWEPLELPLVVGAVQAASVYLDAESDEDEAAVTDEPASVVWGGISLSAPSAESAAPSPAFTLPPVAPLVPEPPAPSPAFALPPVAPLAPEPPVPTPAFTLPPVEPEPVVAREPLVPSQPEAAREPVAPQLEPEAAPEPPTPSRPAAGGVENSINLYDSAYGERLIVAPVFPDSDPEPDETPEDLAAEIAVEEMISQVARPVIDEPAAPEPSVIIEDEVIEEEIVPEPEAAPVAFETMAEPVVFADPERRLAEPDLPDLDLPGQPVARPEFAETPVADSPAGQPLVAQPPAVQPEPVQPPVVQPEFVQPPAAQPPTAQAPAAQAPVVQPTVGREPTQVLGQRPPYAPGQEPGAERAQLTGAAGQPLGPAGTTGPWGAAGFAASQPRTDPAPATPEAAAEPQYEAVAPAAPAVLLTVAGERVALTSPVVIGRSPAAQPGDQMLRVPSPNHDISRTHLRIADDNGRILVTDMNSTNGTIVIFPDGQSTHLANGETIELAIGGAVDLGDGQTISVLAP